MNLKDVSFDHTFYSRTDSRAICDYKSGAKYGRSKFNNASDFG